MVGSPSTHHDVRQLYHQRYDNGVQSGEYVPFTWPLGSYGSIVLLLYLLISPHNCVEARWMRCFIFALIVCAHGYVILYTKAYTMATGFGIGVVYSWGLIWAATLLIFTRPKQDFCRIERREPLVPPSDRLMTGELQEDYKVNQSLRTIDSKVFKRDSAIKSRSRNNPTPSSTKARPRLTQYGECGWYSYPTTHLLERVDWVLDIGSNFRGVGWNWKISGLPSLPASVQYQLGMDTKGNIKDNTTARSGIRRIDSKAELMRHNIWLFVSGYVLVDLILTLSHYDPYFWALFDRPPPSYLPICLQQSGVFLRTYRSFATMAIVWFALQTVFALGPLFFVGVLGPKLIGVRGEPWFYPDHYGNYSIVFDRGLAGWWGSWWHQTFRYGFESGGKWLCDCLSLDKKSKKGRAVQVITAFTLSGCLHAAGSYSMLGDTWPLGSFLFFFFQSFGLMAELILKSTLKGIGVTNITPSRVQQAINFICVHVWFYYTAHLLTDDWARGGIWLAQPLPFSIFRGLGMGVEGERFYCWAWREGSRHSWWHADNSWLKTGIAL